MTKKCLVMKSDKLMTENFFQTSGLAADFAAQSRIGIYVHVPFCPHICPYCDFTKTSKFTRADVTAYFQELEKQFERLVVDVPETIATSTLYLGGGTPSLFPASYFQPLVEKIRNRFRIEEFTVETNPFSNRKKVFAEWVGLGADRMTLGAQSLEAEVLTYLGRKHSPADVLRNIEAARAAGVKQVQVDLIFGVKSSFLERSVSSEIEILHQHGCTGVSCYLLTIEESTPFANEAAADDEEVVREYDEILAACASVGFSQHETSNFAASPAIHNRLYWYGLPYLGLGTGAHGLLPASAEHPWGRRYRVGPKILQRTRGDDELPFAASAESLFTMDFYEDERTTDSVLQEWLMTLLRTRAGIPLAFLESAYSAEQLSLLWNDARIVRAMESGFILKSPTHVALAAKEKLRGDAWSLVFAGILHPC